MRYSSDPRPPRRRAGGALIALFALLVGAVPAVAQDGGDPPPPYRLKPGDRVEVSVSPQQDYNASGTVLPDGILRLRNVGAVPAAGMTVSELEAFVLEKLVEELVNPRITVAITHIAPDPPPPPDPPPMQVTITGAVRQPGALQFTEELRLHKALELRGGPSEGADLRRIIVMDRDLNPKEVDLSTAERAADPAINIVLRDGDSIMVPARQQRQVSVIGAVTSPGSMQLIPGLRVRQAMDLRGGPSENADLRRIEIRHVDLTRTTVDLSTPDRFQDPAHNRELRDGDVVEVPLLFRSGIVSISGAVQTPGAYDLRRGMALDDLIITAGSLQIIADYENVQLQRDGQEIRTINLAEQEKLGLEGRIPLQAGDAIYIPEHSERILVMGVVANEGFRPLREGQTIHDLLFSGDSGLSLDPSKVDMRRVELIRGGGDEVRQLDLTRVRRDREHRDNLVLANGDILYIPAQERRTSWTDAVRSIPPLLIVGRLFGLR